MQTREVKAGTGLNITLEPDNKMLSEVVTIGYGSDRKISSSTASVVKISTKDLETRPSASLFDGLQGKVSGLSVFSSSGEPGAGVSMLLHGQGSLGMSGAPLYILDGVPVSSSMVRSLNLNDFESVQVLKDASATAIYGSRASNGVIFITSKRGSGMERAQLTLNASYGSSSLANRSFYDSFLSSQELADFWVESEIKTQKWVNQFLKNNPHDTKWVDYFYDKGAPTYDLSLSITGGRGRTNYYLSGSHFYQKGLLATSLFSKSNFRFNLNTEVNRWLSISSNNSISYNNFLSSNLGNNRSKSQGLFYLNLPMYTPYREDGEPYWDEMIPGVDFFNPRYVTAMTPETHGTFSYLGSFAANIRPIRGLTLSSRVGLNFSNNHYVGMRSPLFAQNRGNGEHREEYTKDIEWTFTNTAEYRFQPWDGHDFILLMGHEYNQFDSNGFNAAGSGLKDYRLMHLDKVLDPSLREIGSSTTQTAYLSFFGRLSYGLLDRYFIDLTLRDDASSKFPPRN